ncbi:hypothetical protein ODJ79_22975 [Actinoplanes sp. KI2]|nr:hypothetical protein [Actinoplanes sp. KI2]MCU7726605.1 hypothetical protein [Actinoplanes sp. KI2]
MCGGEDFDEFVLARSTGLLRVAYLLLAVTLPPIVVFTRSGRAAITLGT